MCATFQLAEKNIEEVHRIANDIDEKYGAGAAKACLSHDFFPKQEIPAVGRNGRAALLHWGFPMARSSQVVFNARAESLQEKPMFRSFLQNRCLIPATMFYEWGKDKTKYKVAFESLPFFFMAGLWKRGMTADGNRIFYVTIITTAPNEAIGQVHNRMPAILTGGDVQQWLNSEPEGLDLLRPYEQPTMLETA